MSERYWRKVHTTSVKWRYMSDEPSGFGGNGTVEATYGYINKSNSKPRNWQLYGYDNWGQPEYLCTFDDMTVRQVKDAARLILDVRRSEDG
jgi:hypothetical protein